MKKFLINSVIASVIFSPMMTLAQVADTIVTVDPVLTAESTTVSKITVIDLTTGIALPEATITIVAEPVIETANPALDVVYCGDKFIYTAGTYDQTNQPVKAPVCTAYNVKSTSFTTVDFGATATLPVHHFDVNSDGKVVFNEAMNISELVDKVVRGETDSQYYQVQGGEEFEYLIPVNESTAQSLYGDNYQDKVIYFDDSIIYSYKIVR